MYGAEVRIVLITALLSLGRKNTLRCHESNPVQAQDISRHVHQKSKAAKSPQCILKSFCFTDPREQRAREQSLHNVMSISTDTSTVAGDNLFTHSPLLKQSCLTSEQICSYSYFSEKRWVSSRPELRISCNFINPSSLGVTPTSLMSCFCNHLTPALALNSHLAYTCPLYTVSQAAE